MSNGRRWSRWGREIAVMLFAAGLCWPTVAEARRARRPKPDRQAAQKRAQAKALFERAEIQFNLGKFAKALKLYDRAYQVLPLPGFLFNIGQCHRHLRNYERALFFYRGYLRKAADPTEQAVARKLIRLTERLWKEQRLRARVRPRQRVAPRRRGVRPRPRLRPRPGGTGPNPFGAGTGPTDRGLRLHKRWWFWTAIAAGVAAVVGVSVAASMYANRDAEVPKGTLGTIHVQF